MIKIIFLVFYTVHEKKIQIYALYRVESNYANLHGVLSI